MEEKRFVTACVICDLTNGEVIIHGDEPLKKLRKQIQGAVMPERSVSAHDDRAEHFVGDVVDLPQNQGEFRLKRISVVPGQNPVYVYKKVEDRDGVESAGQSDLPTYVDTNLPRGGRFCFPASEDYDLLPVLNEDLPAVEAKDLPGAEDKNPATAETVNGPPSTQASRSFSKD